MDGRTGSLIFVGQLLVGNRKKAGSIIFQTLLMEG